MNKTAEGNPHVERRSPGEYLKELRTMKGLRTYDQAAAATGLSKGTIWNLEHKPGNLQQHEIGTIERLARGYGVSKALITQVMLGATLQEAQRNLEETQRFEVHDNWIEFPVIGSVNAAGDTVISLHDHETVFVPAHKIEAEGITDYADVRIYRVNGSCMVSQEARNAQKSIADGDIIAVNAGRIPEPGDVVVAYWPEREVLIVKRYGVEKENIVLYPAAPGHPMVTLPSEDRVQIIGRVFYRGG